MVCDGLSDDLSRAERVAIIYGSRSGCLRELEPGTMGVFHSGRKLSPHSSQMLCRTQQATTTLDNVVLLQQAPPSALQALSSARGSAASPTRWTGISTPSIHIDFCKIMRKENEL